VDDLNALLAKYKAARTEPTNVEANNDTYMYTAFPSITTHHLHDLSFHAMQEINTTVYDDIVGTNVQHSDEVYSNGVQNTSHELSFDKALRLRAISHAIVCTIQNTRANCLLRVLFDPGTDEAF
jgi:hypothetical protein